MYAYKFIAADSMHGRPTTTFVRFVDNVVVYQRSRMYHFADQRDFVLRIENVLLERAPKK